MPNSVRDGVRPSAASMRAYSSAVRLCCFSSSGEMLAGAGTAESVLVVMAMDILSHDQRGLKGRPSGVSGSNETIDLKPQVPEPQMVAEKSKGASLFRDVAPSYPYFEDLVRQTRSQPKLFRDAREIRAQPWFPLLSRRNVRCTSYLIAIRESRCRFS